MLDYIQTRLREELTVERIAGAASISASECNRCFHSVIHAAPMQYVKTLRLQRASVLLRSSSWKIETVAETCGFQDMSYFSRSFREKFDRTPTECRKQWKRGRGKP